MNSERLRDLLFSYLNETLDQEEFDELLLYVGNDEYDAVFYESMDHDLQTDKIKVLLDHGQQETVYQRIAGDPRFSVNHTETPARGFKIFNVPLMRAAAVLLLISVAVYFAATHYSHISSGNYANNVNPGTSKAILILADGSKISLNDAKKGKLAEQAGINITNTKEGGLVYQVLDNDKADDNSFNTLQTPKGGEYQIQLPDGTKVWLNAESSLKYPASFTAAKERKVTLSGEAYFEVAHQKNIPFRVVTGQQVLEVLGTHFNVNAYTDEPDNRTTLLEGSVKIEWHEAGSGVKQFLIKPGQQARVNAVSAEVANIDTETAVAWKNGDFILKDEDFKTTMRKIGRWYDVEIVYDQSAPEDLDLGGWVSRSKNISAVLKVIESTGKVHFKVQGRRVTVTK